MTKLILCVITYILLKILMLLSYNTIVKFSLRKLSWTFLRFLRHGRLTRFQSRSLEVVGSNPTSATKTKLKGAIMLPFNFCGQQPKC